MAQVAWSDRALTKIEAIRAYIAEDNPVAAAQLVAVLIEAGNSLADFPNRGGRVSGGRRRLVVDPYLIFYRVTHQETLVTILTVRHGAQESH